MKTFEIEIIRIHKGSPYNCSGYIPEINAVDEDAAFNHPNVQSLIKSIYGKSLKVWIKPITETHYFEWLVTKDKAVCQ